MTNYIVSGLERSGTSMMMQILYRGGMPVAFDKSRPPRGDYKIIYMVRNLDEIMDSMEKMSGPIDREVEKPLFEKLNRYAMKLIEERGDIDYIIVKYNDVVRNPRREIEKVNEFLGGKLDVDAAVKAVDPKLYRNVRENR